MIFSKTKKTLIAALAAISLSACDQSALDNETDFLETTSDTVSDLIESNATEEANRLINIARAAERWFEKNLIEPRVHDYDTAYELPMSEIKATGELQMTYAVKPGGSSGTDEVSVLGGGYTVRVVKVDEAGVDKFNISATLGDKAQPLPLAPLANCYVYGTMRLDGVINGWNWHMLPSTTSLTLPYSGVTCSSMSGSMNSIASNIRLNWSRYGAPNTATPETATCQVLSSIPATATQPSGHYEDVVHCFFDYTTPVIPTYCVGELLITMQSGPINSQGLGNLTFDCNATARILFTTSAGNRIAALGLDATAPVCSVITNHYVRCTSTENSSGGGGPGGPGSTDTCDVYVFDQNGVLGSTPAYHWDDTDCTGMNTTTQTILEFLQFDEHFNNVFALDGSGNTDTSIVHSNEFCDLHFDNSGTLGTMFDQETFYNCDNQSKLDEFVFDYNFANPTNQLVGCDEFPGSLSPADNKHKATCERDTASFNTTLRSGSENSEFSCVLVGNNCRLDDGTLEININSLSSLINPASTQVFRGDIGPSGPGSDFDSWRPWLTVSDGSINDLITAGYSYSLNLVLSNSSSNNAIVACNSSHIGTINLNSTNIKLEMDVTPQGTDEGDALCIWQGTFFEYKNGSATGAQSNMTFRIDTDQRW